MPSMPRTRTADPPGPTVRRTERLRAALNLADRASFPLLRASLGVVFIWFGALKIFAATPVGDLVASTLPFLPKAFVVPALGGFEVVLGIGLLVGRYLGVVALLMMAHLTGTFLVLVTQPDVAFQNGNPLLLTMTGEFVVKNLVLITAGLALATWSLNRQPMRVSRPDVTLPGVVLPDVVLPDASMAE